jgi:CheY-like chemotaxis protein
MASHVPVNHGPQIEPMRVLIADDDEDIRTLVADALLPDGHCVTEARDGAELLARLEEALDDPAQRPDVVLTDVMMPGLSGLGVLEAIKRARLRFPVVLMTVLRDDSIHVVAKRLGAVGVLHKPIDLDDLRTAIANAALAFDRLGPGSAGGGSVF